VIICLAALIEHRLATDGQTDRQTDRQMDIVSHGKNIHEILIKTEGNSQYSL